MSTLIGMGPPFSAITEASCPLHREVFDLRRASYLFTRRLAASATRFVLGGGENKASVSLHLTNTTTSTEAPLYLLCQILCWDMNPKIFIGRLKGEGLSSGLGTVLHRTYLAGVMELSSCLIQALSLFRRVVEPLSWCEPTCNWKECTITSGLEKSGAKDLWLMIRKLLGGRSYSRRRTRLHFLAVLILSR